MTYRPRWRRAIVASLIFHILFLGGIGWLAGKLPAPTEPEEPYLELELVTDIMPEGVSADSFMPAAVSAPQTTARITAVPAARTAAASSTAPQAVAAIEDFAVAGVEEVGASQAASSGGEEGTPAGSGTSSGSSGTGNGTGENGNGSGSGARQITRPAILSQVDPDYPEWAKDRGMQGTALLRVQIQKNGLPGNISVISSSGHDILDEAAIAAVRKWRFIPAKDHGSAITSTIKQPIVFRIK